MSIEGPRSVPKTLSNSPLQLNLVSQDDRRYDMYGRWQHPDQAHGYVLPHGQPGLGPMAQPESQRMLGVERGVPGCGHLGVRE